MNNSRWLEKNQYTRIKRKGKKLGADYVDTKYLYHDKALEFMEYLKEFNAEMEAM